MSSPQGPASPPAYNPYAPPVVDVAPPARRKKTRPDRIGVGMVVLFVLLSVVACGMDALKLGGLSHVSGFWYRVASAVLGAVWLHRRWSAMSEKAQCVLAGRRVGPTAAVLFHLMPILQFLWLFKAQMAIRDGVNAEVRPRAIARRAPRDAAIIAPLIQFCGVLTGRSINRSWLYLVMVVAAAIAWTVHMITIERAFAWRRRAPVASSDA